MDFSITTIGAFCTGIGALLGGLITAFITLRRTSSEIRMSENKQTLEVQSQLIIHLTDRVVLLESRESEKARAHIECERKVGVLEGRLDQMTKDFSETIERHANANFEQRLRVKDETINLLTEKLRAALAEQAPKIEEAVLRHIKETEEE